MRMLTLLLLCATVQALRIEQSNDDDEIERKMDANEREIDLFELDHFMPSKDLVKGWIAQWHKLQSPSVSSSVSFGKKNEATIPATCRHDVNGHSTKRAECQDPWPLSRNCENAYEIPGYRLGDLYWDKYIHEHSGPNSIKFYDEFFPESIATKYGRSQHHKMGDSAALGQVIDRLEYFSFEKPTQNDVVVHLRLGDKLTTYAGSFSNMVKSDKFYRDIAKQLKESGRADSTRVVLVTGDHDIMQRAAMNGESGLSRSTKHKTLAYLDKVKKFFTEKGFGVKVRMNMNADCDVVYMANAKTFVESGGGYDRLVKALVGVKGGNVMKSKYK